MEEFVYVCENNFPIAMAKNTCFLCFAYGMDILNQY